jgi:hypothetical protein
MSTGIECNREFSAELKDVAETIGTMTSVQLAVATAMTGVEVHYAKSCASFSSNVE